MNRKGYEFSFAWFFAIIAGAVIIFLAIYATTRLIDVQRFQGESARGREFGILLTPLETNLEALRGATINVPDPTRIINICEEEGTFGIQKIAVQIKSGVGKEWRTETGVESSFYNKYLLSSRKSEGNKEFYTFSKPFLFPFKVADIIVLWSDQESYCLVNPPDEIKEEINEVTSGAIVKNLKTAAGAAACDSHAKKVCFIDTGCDIDISENTKTVKKEGKTLYYIDSLDRNNKYALLYAAIFSDPEVYECQVQRIMKRAASLALLYEQKSSFLTSQGCTSPILQPILSSYAQAALELTSSQDLKTTIHSKALEVKEKNDRLICKLF